MMIPRLGTTATEMFRYYQDRNIRKMGGQSLRIGKGYTLTDYEALDQLLRVEIEDHLNHLTMKKRLNPGKKPRPR